MKKKYILITLLLFALIAAAAAAGLHIYSSVKEKNEQAGFEAFTARAEEFEREKDVVTFGRVYTGADEGVIRGWYFYRFDGELYMNIEYIAGGEDGRELRVTEARLGRVDYDFEEITSVITLPWNAYTLITDNNEALTVELEVTDDGPVVTINDDNGIIYETGVRENEPDFSYPEEVSALTVGGETEIGRYPFSLAWDGTVTYKSAETALGGESTLAVSAYYIPCDEESFYVLTDLRDGGTDYRTALLRYDPDGFTLIDTAEGRIKELAPDGGSVSIETREDLFGSYDATRTFTVSEKGLTAQGSFYTFENEPDPDRRQSLVTGSEEQEKLLNATRASDGSRILTLAKDAEAVDAAGETVTLFAGSVLVPVGYDPEASRFDFTYLGTPLSFTYGIDESTWSYSVDGVSELELFAGVDYDYD